MRIPVVDSRGVALMPCTPVKARHLLKSGKARPKRHKLGLFYVQLCFEQEPDNQPLVAGIDPGSKFEGYSVVGPKDTVLNLMAEAPNHVKAAVKTRRTLRRAQYGCKKTHSKSQQSFESHAVDAWVLAASVSGAEKPSCTRVWYLVPAVLNRRKLHLVEAAEGGKRRPQGGTRSLGLKRGTLVMHPTYGLSAIGGFDRKRQTLSLHEYHTNKRLTQGARVKDCRIMTWVAFRSWLVKETVKRSGKGGHPAPSPYKECLLPPRHEWSGHPQAEVQ